VGRQRMALRDSVDRATAQAEAVRDPLLYGTDKALVSAVSSVLSDADLEVTDLDELFGDTISADLLAARNGRVCCIGR